MMNQYMDANICAADGVMICFHDSGMRVSVPARAGNMPLKTLGAGSLCLKNANAVVVEEGYSAMACAALNMLPPTINEIVLPSTLKNVEKNIAVGGAHALFARRICLRRRVRLDEYEQLRLHSRPAGQGFRVLDSTALDLPACEVMRALLNGMGRRILNDERLEMPLFFCADKLEKTVFAPLNCLMEGAEGPTYTENEGVLRRIAEGDWGARRGEMERQNDRLLQTFSDPAMRWLMNTLVGFSETAAITAGDEAYLTLVALTAKFFNQMVRRVRFSGREYYVYSRRLLTDRTNGLLNYAREDVCVYGPEGLVTDNDVARDVYAKYRLLMML